MDPSVQRLLTDKLYDKRKQGALEYAGLDIEAVQTLTNFYKARTSN